MNGSEFPKLVSCSCDTNMTLNFVILNMYFSIRLQEIEKIKTDQGEHVLFLLPHHLITNAMLKKAKGLKTTHNMFSYQHFLPPPPLSYTKLRVFFYCVTALKPCSTRPNMTPLATL